MKLNVLHSNPNSQIQHRLGVSNERAMELVEQVSDVFLSMDDTLGHVNLECQYQKLAEFCNSIEEYTVAMHVFIFMLARKGNLLSELKINN